MALFEETIREQFPDLHRQGVRMHFIGRRDRCPDSLRELMQDMEARTPKTRGSICGSRSTTEPGPRSSPPRAGWWTTGWTAEAIDEQAVAARLYAPQMPDPDLVIRTSGELRVSNFLLWQAAYAEFHFTPTLWPDFGGDDLREALEAYAGRRRRYGRR